jgi:hypothetical protein
MASRYQTGAPNTLIWFQIEHDCRVSTGTKTEKNRPLGGADFFCRIPDVIVGQVSFDLRR